MSDTAAKLDILIDIKARLDELAKSRAEIKETRKEAGAFGDLMKEGFGINRGMELAKTAMEKFKETAIDSLKKSVELAERIHNGANAAEISTDAFQVLTNAIKDGGGEAGVFSAAVNLQQQKLVEARDTASGAAAAFRTLGITLGEFERMPTEQRWVAIAKANANAKDQNAAYRATAELLGSRTMPQLTGALKDLAEKGYGALLAEQIKAGRIMDEAVVHDLAAMKEQMEQMEQKRTVLAGQVLSFYHLLGKAAGEDFMGTFKDVLSVLWSDDLYKRLADKLPPPPTPPRAGQGEGAAEAAAELQAFKNAEMHLAVVKAEAAAHANDPAATEKRKRADLIADLYAEMEARAQILELIKNAKAINKDNPDANDARHNAEVFAYRELLQQWNFLRSNGRPKDVVPNTANNGALGTFIAPQMHTQAFLNSRYAAQNVDNATVNSSYLKPGEGIMAGMQNWVTQAGSIGQQISGAITSGIGSTVSTVSAGIVGLITKTKTLGDVGRDMGMMFLNALVQIAVQMAAQEAITWALADTHIAAEGVKTGSTFAGSIARGAIRLGETIFHGVQVAIRVGAHLVGEVMQTGITIVQAGLRIASNIAETLSNIIKAASGAMSAMASIPYVGPILAIAAMAAIIKAGSGMMHREHGGDVRAGQSYIVGEKRPEVFVPTQDGMIVPSVDRYQAMQGGGASKAVATGSGGSGSTMAVAAKPQRDVWVVGDLASAKRLSRDPDFDTVIRDSVQRQKGDILNT